MKETYLLASGIFRSGTTWLARALNANKKISFESDPIAPLFNSFRYDIAKKVKKNKNLSRFSPLGDYFGDETELIKDVLESKFNISVKNKDLNLILQKIKGKNLPFENGKWTSTFKGFENSKNYHDAIIKVLKHIKKVSKKKSNISGFKEVWVNEMAGPFLNSFKNSKVILIVRDPRAILASRNAMLKKYPPIFIGRQWRKSILIANYLKRKFSDRVLILKYETATSDKEKTLINVCKFLGIKFDKDMANESKYTDGLGNPWKQNSSFTTEGKKYLLNAAETKKISNDLKKNYLKKNNKNAKEKWKTELDKKDVMTIEFLCHNEMKKFGYPLKYKIQNYTKFNIKNFKNIKVHKLADWIKPYSIDKKISQIRNIIQVEIKRIKLLKNKKFFSFKDHIF